MATTWTEIYQVAVDLSKGQTEAHWRSSISRAYYACFHLARTVTKVQPKGHDSHAQVWYSLIELGKRKHPSRDYTAAAKKGQALKVRREDADYELSNAMPKSECLDALEKARKLIDDLKKLQP